MCVVFMCAALCNVCSVHVCSTTCVMCVVFSVQHYVMCVVFMCAALCNVVTAADVSSMKQAPVEHLYKGQVGSVTTKLID